MSENSRILIGQIGDLRWIRIEGKGSFQNSPALKESIRHARESGAKQFVVDFEACGGIDSTFIGALTGLVLAVDRQGGFVGLANAGPRILQLIRSLGIDSLFEIDETGESWSAERVLVAAGLREAEDDSTREEKAQVSLDAHKALGEANAENVPRFKDVVEFLRRDLG